MRKDDLVYRRKNNMKLYPIHKMLAADYLFFYAIKILFLTQIKSISMSDIVISTGLYGLFLILVQIPSSMIVEKYGDRKSLILGDLALVIGMGFIMLCDNFFILLLDNFIMAFGFGIKGIAEGTLLTKSIPPTAKKNEIFAKLDGKGLGNYYYISAITAALAGYLYSINGYIPIFLSLFAMLIALRLAFLFEDISDEEVEKKKDKKEEARKQETLAQRYKESFEDIRLALKFIFNSGRLKALMIYAALTYGLVEVIANYQVGLMEEIGMTSTWIGIVYAIAMLLSGIASKKQNIFHEQFRNKSLGIIGMVASGAIFVAGLTSLTILPFAFVAIVVSICIISRYISTGLYNVLIKKYLANFTNTKMLNRVYATYGIVTGVGAIIMCFIAGIIVKYVDLRYAMTIMGIIFVLSMLLTIWYMRKRVGLKPEEYAKKDIDFKAYLKDNNFSERV